MNSENDTTDTERINTTNTEVTRQARQMLT